MQVTIGNFYPPKQGTYGINQGGKITTEKGEFPCYNDGPIWFMMPDDTGKTVEVRGEWKQTKSGKNIGKWYLACEYGDSTQQQQGQSQVPQPPQMPTANIPTDTFPPSQPACPPVKPQRNTGLSIERQSAIKSACSLLAGTNADLEEVVKTAERFTYFYESGKAPIQGNQDGFLNQDPSYEEDV